MPKSSSFKGLRVAAFESRQAGEMARLIERFEGRPLVSPSMREAPLASNRAAVDFANHLITGQVDVVILMTGVGTRHLVAAVERHVPRQQFLDALSDVITVARGPKSVAAMKELGLTPTIRVPEPNTWREVLATLDLQAPVANKTVVVQEYGLPNSSLTAGLEARGATVVTLKVYDWELPADTEPLEQNVRAICEGQVDVVLFTSSQQVVNLLQIAQRLGMGGPLRESLENIAVASVGPTTTETLRAQDLPVDIEPEHPKMGQLVQAAAVRAGDVLARKRRVVAALAERPERARDPEDPALASLFMRACRREPTERTPIWLMRQAGRYLPEYREIRGKTTFLELCKDPALSAEVMIRTVRRLGVDAAIIFSDLLPILEPMGFALEFAEGEGPVIHNPVREASDLDRVRELETVESLEFVMETVRQTRAGLPGIPIIGFAGSPFTLASYTIEGGASRNYLHTKTLMYRDEGAWRALLSRLAGSVSRYLNAQITAGAHAVQLFDSWVGCLSPADYRRYALPFTRAVISQLPAGVPVINFATGNPELLPLLAEAGGDVIGLDWRIDLADGWRKVGYDRGVQGNLDPLVLLADRATIRQRAQAVLAAAAGRPGHIFNLGHGVLPQTPVDNVLALLDDVRELSAS